MMARKPKTDAVGASATLLETGEQPARTKRVGGGDNNL